MIRELRKLFNITGMLRRFIILTLLRCPFDALYTAVQALFLKHAFDAVNNAQTSSLFITCILFGVGNIILFLYNGTVWTVYTAFVTNWTAVLRRKLFRHIGSLSLRQIEMRTVGEWITRLNSDLHAATAMLNQPIHIPHAVVSLVNAVVSSVILASADMMMFSLVILFAVPHMLISRLIVAKPMTRLATDVQEAAAENASDMNAIIVCAAEALIYDAQSFCSGVLKKQPEYQEKEHAATASQGIGEQPDTADGNEWLSCRAAGRRQQDRRRSDGFWFAYSSTAIQGQDACEPDDVHQ